MKKLGILIRVVWVGICVVALAFALKGYGGSPDWKVEEGLAWEMFVLSFPASMLVAFAGILLRAGLEHFSLTLPSSSRPEMVILWFLFVIAGYVQWFVVIPRFVRLWRDMLRN